MDNSSEDTKAPQPGLGQGISQINEAIQQSMTASRLMWAGAFAVGAGVTAYLWDTKRRTDFMDAARKWSDDITKVWGSTATNFKPGANDPGSGD